MWIPLHGNALLHQAGLPIRLKDSRICCWWYLDKLYNTVYLLVESNDTILAGCGASKHKFGHFSSRFALPVLTLHS